jgi:small subunit ribosomal protein S4e
VCAYARARVGLAPVRACVCVCARANRPWSVKHRVSRGVPYIVTHDGRTIRYPDPLIKVNDSVKFDLEQGKIVDFVKFDTGNIVMITGGRNMGRAGVIVHREKHMGGFDIVHVKDSLDRTFATRITNIFVIGEGIKPWISLPKGKGTKLSITEERDVRRKQKAAELQ